jgi:hybrid cluster-associated redox disulfide protein
MSPDIHDPDLPLAELFRHWPEAARPFLARRMACVGCPIAPFHTVSDACAEYALAERRFRSALKAAVRPRRSGPRAGAEPSR